MYDVITIGSATVDVFTNSSSSQVIKIKNNDSEDDYIAFKSGNKIIIDSLNFKIGGGGTNTAVSFARLGLKTAYLGKLGEDDNASKVLNLLKQNNIDFLGKQEGKTGYSVILDSLEHDRTILTFKGANNHLKQSDITLSSLKSKWLYASSMVRDSFNTLESIMNVVKRTGTKLAFNPSSYQVQKGLSELKQILEILDVLVLNKEEAQTLLHSKEEDWQVLVKEIAKYGPKYVLITDGAKGVICFNDDVTYILSTSGVKCVESTGAGDAFASAFVAGLVYDFSVKDALRFGMVQSESVISQIGAKEGLLTKHEAFEKLQNFKGKLQVISEKKEKLHVAEKGKEFTLNNGDKIYTLSELPEKLNNTSDEVFGYHVNGENHFAKWIDQVFGLKELANKVINVKTKAETIQIVTDYLKGCKNEN